MSWFVLVSSPCYTLCLISQPLLQDSFESFCMLRNVDLICRFFNLSTGLVAISPLSLSSHVKPWQKDVHTRVFLNAQGMNKQGIFTICSTACRFALSCADGLTVVHLKMDLAKASSDSKKKVENQDIPGFFSVLACYVFFWRSYWVEVFCVSFGDRKAVTLSLLSLCNS